MPVNITDVDEFTDPLTEAANGDQVDSNVRLTHGQKIANRTRYLANRTPGAVGTVPWPLPISAAARHNPEDIGGTGRWEFAPEIAGVRTPVWLQVAADTATPDPDLPQLYITLPRRVGTQLTAARVRLHGDLGGTGAHPDLPSTLPRLEVIALDVFTGVATLVASADDAPADVAAYETAHDLSITGLTQDLSGGGGDWVTVCLFGEGGTNALGSRLAAIEFVATLQPS